MSARWDTEEYNRSSRDFREETFPRFSEPPSLNTSAHTPAPAKNPLVEQLNRHINEEIVISGADIGSRRKFTLLRVYPEGAKTKILVRAEGDCPRNESLIDLDSISNITFKERGSR